VWGNYFFLYEILVAFLFNHLGHISAAVVFGLIGSLAVWILTAGRRLTFWQILVFGLGLSIATANLAVRPSMISFLFISVLLFFLDRRFFTKIIYSPFWFGFFVLWANFHQGFVIGLAVLGAYLGIDFFWKRTRSKDSSLVNRIFIFSAAILGTLVTPYHLGLWQTIIKDLTGTKIWTGIAEWMPIIFYFPANVLFALSGLIFIYMLVKKFREVEPVWFLLGAGMFCFAFLVNNLTFFWIAIFIFITSRYFDFKLNLAGDFWAKFSIIFSFSAVFLAFALNFLVNLSDSIGLERRLTLDNYPVEAVKYLKREGLIKGLFNDYGWGGFIDWKLSEAKVFIDGRMTGWRRAGGRYILADYLSVIQGKCEVIQKYDIKVVLVKKAQETSCFADFQHIYEDSVAKVLVKNQ
jgi:MFS family permease